MEQAIFISDIKKLKQADSKYSRLYFGNEFCQRLIPSLEDCKGIMDFVLGQKMNFTLVTPYVTDGGVRSLRPILEYIIGNLPGSEIVINDWGVLRLLRKEFNYPNFVLGRLLTKQKRGPRIMNLMGKVPQAMIQHFKESNIDVPIVKDFLANCGIKRIELDNLLQGITREGLALRASLYVPFAYITSTRFCLVASCETGRKYLRSMPACNKECRRYTFRLRHKTMPVDVFLRGNTQFFRNERMPEDLDRLKIDRIVYQPEIPM